jgi:ribose 1,5-bisphosphokinase
MSAPGDERVGSGCLVLVVGPSGAGKDTLMSIAANKLRAQARIVFGRRIVTRAADSSEDHDSLTPEAFDAAQARGAFALAWRAHGHGYSVPRAAMHRLETRDTLVFNVSRGVVAAARAQFANVRVVYVTAPPDILENRLKARGRDGDIAARLKRSAETIGGRDADLVIENVGDRDANAGILVTFLEETLGPPSPPGPRL